MNANEYLQAVLLDQTLTAESEELKKLREHREEVEALLRSEFSDASPTIRYGGSKAKGTMIKEAFDLDIACYFPHDETGEGETLSEIYENVQAALQTEYLTEPKTSAIRLKDPSDLSDFHIDMIPGRFVEGNDGDVYIFQASAEKCRLKTNLDIHIAHIRDSGVTDAIRLLKFWVVRNTLNVKTFVLELLVVDLLKTRKNRTLATQLRHVWTELRDNAESLGVEDPANPTGNDLSGYLNSIRSTLSRAAGNALESAENDNWEVILGAIEDQSSEERTVSLGRIAAGVSAPQRPWYRAQ